MELDSFPFETRRPLDIEARPWHGFNALDKLIAIVLPILGVAALAVPFTGLSILHRLTTLPGMAGPVDWLVNGNGSWIAGFALFAIWLAYLLIRRQRIVSNEHQWVDAGCPLCQEYELVRVSRERSDRWYGLLNIPAYRYACRNCTWRGLRIAHRHPYRVLAQEDMIVASSLTLEETGTTLHAPAAQVEASAPTPESAARGQTAPLEPLPTDDVATSELANAQPEWFAEAAGTAEVPQNNHQATTNPGDDDLEWLWRRLSDDN